MVLGPLGNNKFEILLTKVFRPKQKRKYFRLLYKKSNFVSSSKETKLKVIT